MTSSPFISTPRRSDEEGAGFELDNDDDEVDGGSGGAVMWIDVWDVRRVDGDDDEDDDDDDESDKSNDTAVGREVLACEEEERVLIESGLDMGKLDKETEEKEEDKGHDEEEEIVVESSDSSLIVIGGAEADDVEGSM